MIVARKSAEWRGAEEWAHSEQMQMIAQKYLLYSPPTIEVFMTLHGPLVVLWEHDDTLEDERRYITL